MVRRIAGHLRLDADALANQLGTISTPTRKPIITAAASMTASPARRRRGMLLPIVLLIAAGGGGAMLLRTRLAMSPVQTPAESMEKPASPTPQQPVPESKPVSAALPEPLASSLTISSREPSWIALRRNGNLDSRAPGERPHRRRPGQRRDLRGQARSGDGQTTWSRSVRPGRDRCCAVVSPQP